MNNKVIILCCVLISCASPVKTTIVNKEIKLNKQHISELVFYEPSDSIKYEYLVIAEIEIDNKAIWGNLLFDNKMRKYILDSINEIGADALIYNEEKSNKYFSYFHAIKYSESDLYQPEFIYD